MGRDGPELDPLHESMSIKPCYGSDTICLKPITALTDTEGFYVTGCI